MATNRYPWDLYSEGRPVISLKCGEDRDGVERHADVHRGGELRAHSAHALAGGSQALLAFALDHQHVAASRLREMPGDAGSHDAAADNYHICRFGHVATILPYGGREADTKFVNLLARSIV